MSDTDRMEHANVHVQAVTRKHNLSLVLKLNFRIEIYNKLFAVK